MSPLRLRVKAVTWEAPDILSYELRPLDGKTLPGFTAGAHINLALPGGMVRSYSLVNSQAERHRYVIAVQKDRASRGGSKWLHETLRAGDLIDAHAPRNNFALNEAARRSVFIAGGIGITPILSMIDRLQALGRDWSLTYCARTREGAAYLDLLGGLPQVRLNFDQEPGCARLDMAALLRGLPMDAHVYCCGPLPMLRTFEEQTKDRPAECIHVEYFATAEAAAREGGFDVVLARKGKTLYVPPGKSILDVLLANGIVVPYSCSEGLCGTCETHVLEGEPDHRDMVLSKEEHAANDRMMVCCSGARTKRLVLDL